MNILTNYTDLFRGVSFSPVQFQENLKMTAEQIIRDITNKLNLYDIRKWGPYPETKKDFRRAAVLLPLSVRNGEIFILLTKRSKHLRNHPSAVSFPGGMREKTDVSDIETALREAEEEIGLPPDNVQILAVLTRGVTLPNTVVYPVVGLIPTDFVPKPNPMEVEYAFFMPLKTFLNEESVSYSTFVFRGKSLVSPSVLYTDGNLTAVVWGFTANFCTFLAKIIFGSTESLPIFSDSVSGKKKLESDLVAYFDFITSEAKAKL
ncbi:Peroxisomal coenzyme A diphosphatase nudt7 [Bulinus truncatus]|nr:Peroxisomal coenzyme A diphosphatase nudt7 [Bulinus truncatus]